MTRDEQKQFLRDLTRSILASLEADINAGHIPEEWDGIELRWWLANKAQEQAPHNLNPLASRRSESRRFRDFKEELLTRDL